MTNKTNPEEDMVETGLESDTWSPGLVADGAGCLSLYGRRTSHLGCAFFLTPEASVFPDVGEALDVKMVSHCFLVVDKFAIDSLSTVSVVSPSFRTFSLKLTLFRVRKFKICNQQ